jgi:glycosyltransferase involved in cell wall biosynthesis
VEMPAHYPAWRDSTFTDVSCVPEPVGDWWFERPWTGEIDKALFVLAGKDVWRPEDKTVCGLDWWKRIEERFPGRTHHHDGAVEFKTARQMTELLSKYRVFVNLDRQDARPLAAVFTEAVAAGMPVVARDHPTLSYRNFIDGNGKCSDSFEDLCEFIAACLHDHTFAKMCSNNSRCIGLANFSSDALRPKYLGAAQRARQVFESFI